MCRILQVAPGTNHVVLGTLVIGLLALGVVGCTPVEPVQVASVTDSSDSGWSDVRGSEADQSGSPATGQAATPADSESGTAGSSEGGAAGSAEGGSASAGSSGSEQLAQAGTPKPSYPPGVELVPIPLELPPPAFKGTPVPLKEPHVEKPRGAPREPFLAPAGTYNLAGSMPVTCSDPIPVSGEVDYVTDGAKEASDFGYLELHPGSQWVQIDLGRRATIYAVVLWHNHAEARVYRDVIVQVSDDPDFLTALTVFNNDYDNSSGLGIGQDMGYVETSEGKLIDCGGVEGRYVRLYSNGNHIDAKNHYAEVEVFGRPAE